MGATAGMIADVTGGFRLAAYAVHESPAPSGWAFEPLPLFGLLLMAVGYASLAIAARRRGQSVARGRVLLFGAGVALIAVALFSPIDPYGEEHSPAVHMIQHEMLLMIAPLALVVGLEQRLVMPISRLVLRPIGSGSVKARLWRGVLATLGNPWFVVSAWSVVTLGWHLPVMYNLSLANRTVHNIEHLSLIGVGVMFWVVLIGRLPSVHHTTIRERMGALGVAMAVGGVVGAAFIWWPTVLYSRYLDARPWFGLSPWDDQRLAGAIMMIVDMPLLLGAMLVIAGRWAHREVHVAEDSAHPPSTDRPADLTTSRRPHSHA